MPESPWPAPVKGKTAEVSAAAWESWTRAKDILDQAAAIAKSAEDEVRAQIGDAAVITVNGAKVATRVIRQVENASWTDDHFRRVKR